MSIIISKEINSLPLKFHKLFISIGVQVSAWGLSCAQGLVELADESMRREGHRIALIL